MERLSKEAEAKILTALGDVADLVNGGLGPTDAIVKAASNRGIPPGHVQLMVSAYNTGRTHRQRADGTTLSEKAAEFELADTATALERLYPSQVKTAAAKFRDEVVDPEYSLPPDCLPGRSKPSPNFTIKVAGASTKQPPSDAVLMKTAWHNWEKDKRRLEDCRREIDNAHTVLLHGFDKLATYFKTDGHLSFTGVREAVSLLHGKPGEAVMAQLARSNPRLEKEAKQTIAVDDAEPFRTIAACATIGEELAGALPQYEKLARQVHDRNEAALRPFALQRGSAHVLEAEKRAAGFTPYMGTLEFFKNMGRSLSQLDPNAADPQKIQHFVDDLDDPAHAQQIRSIQAQSVLQDLMANDPTISQHPPAAVMGAYNDIVQMSPRSSTQRLLLQGLLRRHLEQGGLDPFDVTGTVLKGEEALQKRDAGSSPAEYKAPGAGMKLPEKPKPIELPGPFKKSKPPAPPTKP